ncbi:MAG: hypothetical protein SNJ78_06920 [Spirochaetales bacterium]
MNILKTSRSFFCFLCFILSSYYVWGDTIYRSNELGMPLEILKRGDPVPEFRLIIAKHLDKETRTLLDAEGTEVKRWERFSTPSGIEEREYDSQGLKEKIFYDSRGRVLRIESHDFQQGGVIEYTVTEGKYLGSIRTSLNGEFELMDRILYTSKGLVRGIVRSSKENVSQAAFFSQDRGILRRETFQGERGTLLSRYNSRGEIVYQEVRRGEKVVEVQRFFYQGEPSFKMARKEIENPLSGRKVQIVFNEEGNIEREIEIVGGVFSQETFYIYRGRVLLRKESRTRAGQYVWEFQYSDQDKKIEERQYEKGILVLKIEFDTPDGFTRVESRYREGDLIMKTYFQEEKEIKVEYYRGGTLLRTVQKG